VVEVAEEATQEMITEIEQREDKKNRNHYTSEEIIKTKIEQLVRNNNNKRVNINHIMKIDNKHAYVSLLSGGTPKKPFDLDVAPPFKGDMDKIKDEVWPGFPVDLIPQTLILALIAKGNIRIYSNMYEVQLIELFAELFKMNSKMV
jgi:hypothetical protein